MPAITLSNLLHPRWNLYGQLPLSATISGAEFGLPKEIMAPDAINELKEMNAKIHAGAFTLKDFLRTQESWAQEPEWSLQADGHLHNRFFGYINGVAGCHTILRLDLTAWLKQQDEATLRRLAVVAFHSFAMLGQTRPITQEEAAVFGNERIWYLEKHGILTKNEEEFLAIAGLAPIVSCAARPVSTPLNWRVAVAA